MSVQMTARMTARTFEPPSLSANRLPSITVRRLEVFIVPLDDGTRAGYRVHLLLATDAGPLAAELALEAREKPADWVTWSYRLRKVVHTDCRDDIALERALGDRGSFHCRLVRAALQPFKDGQKPALLNTRATLIELASSYICLF
ncbi:hypothetical protein [Cohnella rhizosphaerae]|uniref:Uncharacterized protein n=1 Tax=Cohnella rhizosphaerae TaxID=1457232 RepID=A0A9X4KS20_9BACL|nr:hypothetical protein [Cohnella rhizosphaerae]MDG0809865.1 hypothetical protein [Cohnella rhizosphaerae]